MRWGTHPEWTFKQFGEKTLPSGCFLEKDKLLSVSGKPHNPRSTFTADKDSDWLHMEQHKLPGSHSPPLTSPTFSFSL